MTAADSDLGLVAKPRWLTSADAAHRELVTDVCQLVNTAYDAAQEGLWQHQGGARVTPAEIATRAAAGEIAIVEDGCQVRACIRMLQVAPKLGEMSMLACGPGVGGQGLGRLMLQTAETEAKQRQWTKLQLEVLTPKVTTHPSQLFLDRWYQRHGYEPQHDRCFAATYPDAGMFLAQPCWLRLYSKSL